MPTARTEYESDSECVGHEPCPSCGSRDNLGRYSDGHGFCFGCKHYEPATGVERVQTGRPKVEAEFIETTFQDLPKRGISEATCRKFGYGVGTNSSGRTVQVAGYRDADGRLVAQKIRTADKKFTILGSAKEMGLFGQHLWREGGRRVVVTEGEIDALSVAEATGGTWAVVSLPNGAAAAKKAVSAQLEWLSSYEQVVLCFDMDEAGRTAASDCAALFAAGKCAIAELPRKDANELLVAGEAGLLSKLLWQGRVWRPDGILGLAEIRDRVLTDLVRGYPWFVPGLDTVTYGRRPGELIGIGAGTGCGKTDFLSQQIAFDLEQGLTVGVIYLEQDVGDTGRRIAGKSVGHTFHIPGTGWTQGDLEVAWGAIQSTNRLFFYDNFGAMDWPTVQSKIRYMATVLKAEVVYLDHLTALAAAESNEREALEKIMAELASLCKELKIVVVFVSHLATPDGTPHEEGGRVTVRHFKGSRAIGYWSHALIGLERDTQKPGEPTTIRVLKDRYTGQANGFTTGLAYDSHTGLQSEVALTQESGHGFTDETGSDVPTDSLPF